jgi:8-oxo-dGTP pyrophosphatase MutT (NUDIX family)
MSYTLPLNYLQEVFSTEKTKPYFFETKDFFDSLKPEQGGILTKMSRKNGSWTIKNSKKIFENDFFKVVEDDVIGPDEKESKYATIDLKPGVAVLPIDDDGFVYITRQFRYAIGRFNLEAIAGTVEGEDALTAAKREAKEELGIEADEWLNIGRMEAVTSITNSHADLYLAQKLKFSKPETEGTEELELVKLPLAGAHERVMQGEITHAETCVLVLKAAARK